MLGGMPAGTAASAQYGAGVERQEVYHNQFKKTVVCRFFLNNACKRGTKCTFAHSASELQDVPDLRKTALCKQWKQGLCRFSTGTCPFAHGKHELRMSPAFMQHSSAKWLPPSEPSSESTWSLASGASSQSLSSIESSPRLDEAQKLEGPPELQPVPPQWSSQWSHFGKSTNTLQDLKHFVGANHKNRGQALPIQTSFAESHLVPIVPESLLAPITPPQPKFPSLHTGKHDKNSASTNVMGTPGPPTPEDTEPAFVKVYLRPARGYCPRRLRHLRQARPLSRCPTLLATLWVASLNHHTWHRPMPRSWCRVHRRPSPVPGVHHCNPTSGHMVSGFLAPPEPPGTKFPDLTAHEAFETKPNFH